VYCNTTGEIMARCWAGGECTLLRGIGLKGITVGYWDGLPCPPDPYKCPYRGKIGPVRPAEAR